MTLVSNDDLPAGLRRVMARPLPGLAAQLRMASAMRPRMEVSNETERTCRKAAVLLLIYPVPEDGPGASGHHIVLTLRTEKVSTHRGQVSFPGGQLEPGETTIEAALREAREELCVDLEQITVLGQLTPLYIPPSGFCIYPVVAYAARRPDYRACTDEVAAVIEVSLQQLLQPSTRVEEMWMLRDAPVRVPFYAVNDYKVWGATAMVLSELLELISDFVSD